MSLGRESREETESWRVLATADCVRDRSIIKGSDVKSMQSSIDRALRTLTECAKQAHPPSRPQMTQLLDTPVISRIAHRLVSGQGKFELVCSGRAEGPAVVVFVASSKQKPLTDQWEIEEEQAKSLADEKRFGRGDSFSNRLSSIDSPCLVG